MGVLSVLEWDALMLDHRDQAILMALPLRPRTIFAAKFRALAQFMLIFSVDINAGSILLLPPLEMVGKRNAGFFNCAATLAPTPPARSARVCLSFLFVVAVQATLITLFTPRWFRRISTVVQVAAILTLLAALFFFPAVMEQMPVWKLHNSALFRCFLRCGTSDCAKCCKARRTRNSRPWREPVFTRWPRPAPGPWPPTRWLTDVTRRASLEIPAKAAGKPREREAASRPPCATGLAHARIRSSALRSVSRSKTMRHSPKHRLILAAYVGTGLAIVLEEIVTLSFRGGENGGRPGKSRCCPCRW